MRNREEIMDEIAGVTSLMDAHKERLTALNLELQEVDNAEKAKRLKDLEDEIAFEGYRDISIDDDSSMKRFREVGNYLSDVGDLNQIRHCQYSCYEKGLGDIAVKGTVTLAHDGWGDNLYTETIDNPTWLDIWKFADVAIAKTDDFHHVFLEGIHKRNDKYYLSMGS